MNQNNGEHSTTVSFRTARSREEIERCYSIVYQEWEKVGYVSGGVRLRYSLYNALPSTTTFVGVSLPDSKVFMTATIIRDSQMGMPIDAIFNDKLAPYREAGKKLAEVSMLAFDSSSDVSGAKGAGTKRLALLLQMFRTILEHARASGIDVLCVKVHPRHASSYDMLMFEDFGETRDNPFVSNMPVTGKALDLSKIAHFCATEENQKTFPCNVFFDPASGQNDSKAIKESEYRFSEQDLKHFFVDLQPIFQKTSKEERGILRSLYPEVDFSRFF